MHKFTNSVQPSSEIINRFFRYVNVETTSDEHTAKSPTTEGQRNLGTLLADELRSIGLSHVRMDDYGYVYGSLPSNLDDETSVPSIGFIAHMDTSPDAPGSNIHPRIIRNYDGNDILLNEQKEIVMHVSDFPELTQYKGEDLIVTDGTTLLGADDKAGITEIVSAMEWLCKNPEFKHGTVCVAFTPDEEIGRGADHFDVEGFGADWAYTVDGGARGELQFENFNAARARVSITGRSVHPGAAKGKMVNALLVGSDFINTLPEDETPAQTDGYQGFYHLVAMEGTVESATIDLIIRDHDAQRFSQRKERLQEIVTHISQLHPHAEIDITIEDQYRNMREKIEPVMHVVQIAERAMTDIGITPLIVPIRGGTDGAQLSFRHLPCPNLFAGGENFHGRFEYLPVTSLVKATETILQIIRRTATSHTKKNE